MFRKALISLILCLCPLGLLAQEDGGMFPDYPAMKARMDELVSTRRIADLMVAFGGADEMTPQQLAGLEQRVRSIFPRDFEASQLIRRQDLQNNWRQEMWAYFYGTSYLYVYLLIHERPGMSVAVNFKFNTDFDEIFVNF